MIETWKAIPEWEGYYEVSDAGNVRSLDREVSLSPHGREPAKYIKAGRLLSLRHDKDGYLCCRLQVSERVEHHRVHRLVCRAFNGPAPTPSHVVAHGDGSRTNNSPSNLRWATPKENTQDRLAHGTYPKGAAAPHVKIRHEQAERIRGLLRSGIRQPDVAKRFGVSTATVTAISTRRHWTDRHVLT